jgi:membrane associated rhomboid family serine protease
MGIIDIFVTAATAIFGVLLYLSLRRFQPKNGTLLNRRPSMIFIVFAIPIFGHWAFVTGVDPLVITFIVLIGTLAAVLLISRHWR